MLTFLPLEQIYELEKLEGSQLNKAKEILAYEVTKLIHGQEEADKAQAAAKSIFGAGGSENMPETKLEDSDFTDGEITVLDAMVKAKLAASKSEARRLVVQGGVSVDDLKVTDPTQTISKATLEENGFVVIKKGKKAFNKITL